MAGHCARTGQSLNLSLFALNQEHKLKHQHKTFVYHLTMNDSARSTVCVNLNYSVQDEM